MPAGGRVSVRERRWAKISAPAAPGLDTLAQVGTELADIIAASPGKTFTIKQNDPVPELVKFAKRARAKYLTTAITLKLVDVEADRMNAGALLPGQAAARHYAPRYLVARAVRPQGEVVLHVARLPSATTVATSRLVKGYWNTYHCSSVLENRGGKLVTQLCRNRWCTVCSRIRTAQLIEQYLPILRSWDDKHLVTLTVVNVPGEALTATVLKMKKVFNTIRERIKKQYQRGQRTDPLRALRKLECTFNPRRQDYHPHFHVITADREMADFLLSEWLRHFPTSDRKGQDVRPADDNSVMELFKYFTKLVTGKGSEDATDGKRRYIYANALNVIFNALTGQRVFQVYNVEREVGLGADRELEQLPPNLEIGQRWVWNQAATDWVAESADEVMRTYLTGYEPSPAFRQLVEESIITGRRERPPPPE